MHARELRTDGDSEDRISAVAAWRDTPFFTDAERAALALTEAATRIADRGDPVDDATWASLRSFYDEAQALEATILVGFYRMMAGFVNTIGVEREPAVPGWFTSA